ncbi:hypothetical protein JCM8097_008538 [Rhodosporidiobolus ruineniae]
MPLMLRRKSRNALAPSPPPTSSNEAPPSLRTDLGLPFAPLRSSSDLNTPLAGSGDVHEAASAQVHTLVRSRGGFHTPTPYAYSRTASPPTASADGHGLPRSPSDPTGWGSTLGVSASSSSSSVYSSIPPYPPPSFAIPPLPPGPASVNYASARRSIASLHPSPNYALLARPSPPPPPGQLPPHIPYIPKSTSSPAALSSTTGSPVPPSSPPRTAQSSRPTTALSPSQRRPRRAPPSYTLLLAGARRTGKTNFARALVEVLDRVPAGRVELAVPLEDEGGKKARVRRTTLDITEEGEKLALTMLDAEGIDLPYPFQPRNPAVEQLVERQMDALAELVTARFEQMLRAEGELHRSPVLGGTGGGGGERKGGDPLVHLAIWFVHPEGLVREEGGEWRMGGLELRCIRRLAERVNVLPVLTLSDTLTLPSLACAKTALRSSFSSLALSAPKPASPASPSGLDTFLESPNDSPFDLFRTFFGSSPSSTSSPRPASRPSTSSPVYINDDRTLAPRTPSRSPRPNESAEGRRDGELDLPVVVHLTRNRSRARPAAADNRAQGERRGRADRTAEPEPEKDGAGAEEEGEWADEELKRRWPFALVAPDWEAGGGAEEGSKTRLRREYRHGIVSILDPSHCDFLPLRHALFGERMERLKSLTCQHFYEPYRTAKLLEQQRQQHPSTTYPLSPAFLPGAAPPFHPSSPLRIARAGYGNVG